MKTVLAADFGGTKCRFALVAEDFAVHRVTGFATVHGQPAFLAAVAEAIAGVRAGLPPGLEAPRARGRSRPPPPRGTPGARARWRRR